jgi:hypothetical protein
MGVSQVAPGASDRTKPADLDSAGWPRASIGACRSRTNADDRLPLESLGRVQRGDSIVQGRDGADVRPQSSVPDPLDDLTQLGAIGLDKDTLKDVGGVDLVFDVIGGDMGSRKRRWVIALETRLKRVVTVALVPRHEPPRRAGIERTDSSRAIDEASEMPVFINSSITGRKSSARRWAAAFLTSALLRIPSS